MLFIMNVQEDNILGILNETKVTSTGAGGLLRIRQRIETNELESLSFLSYFLIEFLK